MEIGAEKIDNLILKLFEIKAIKFGCFKLKSGVNSPIYFDLRVIISYPDVMESVSDLLCELGLSGIKFDHVCGVPYTALPIATLISVKVKTSMLIRRKETKDYGTKKTIEGHFNQGDSCIIIEDVITTGSSILETANDLRKEGLNVDTAFIILDREQGATVNLNNNKIKVHSLFNITRLLAVLLRENKIEESTVNDIKRFLNNLDVQKVVEVPRYKLKFEDRAEIAENPVARRLFRLMHEKRSNLCIAADLSSSARVLELLSQIGPLVCIFKIHVDIIEDFSEEFIDKLTALANKFDVLLMEDRKFADIGNTVALQYMHGIHKIAKWADLITIHSVAGPGAFQAIKNSKTKDIGLFIVTEMSCEGNLMNQQYVESTLKMCSEHSELVAGFVCQNKDIVKSGKHVQLTPGVKLVESKDNLGQIYNSPDEIIINRGADVAVVGRGITNAADPAKETSIYKNALWKCYERRITQDTI